MPPVNLASTDFAMGCLTGASAVVALVVLPTLVGLFLLFRTLSGRRVEYKHEPKGDRRG